MVACTARRLESFKDDEVRLSHGYQPKLRSAFPCMFLSMMVYLVNVAVGWRCTCVVGFDQGQVGRVRHVRKGNDRVLAQPVHLAGSHQSAIGMVAKGEQARPAEGCHVISEMNRLEEGRTTERLVVYIIKNKSIRSDKTIIDVEDGSEDGRHPLHRKRSVCSGAAGCGGQRLRG